MKVGSYTSYVGYPVDGFKAREIKVTYNIHENKCNGKKKPHQFMCDFYYLQGLSDRLENT